MNYDLLEKAVVDRLQGLRNLGFEVVAIPENDKDVDRPFRFGRVTVAYLSSQFNEDGFNGKPFIFSTNEIVQKETAELEIILQCRVRSGAEGLHALQQRVRTLLVGFEPDSWGKMYCREMRYVSHQDGIWTYALTMFCSAISIQAADPYAPAPVYISRIIVCMGDEITILSTARDMSTYPVEVFKENNAIGLQYDFEENGLPVDRSGYTFRWALKQFATDPVTLMLKTPTPTGSTVYVSMSAVENVLLPGNYKAILEVINSFDTIENEIVVNILIEPQYV